MTMNKFSKAAVLGVVSVWLAAPAFAGGHSVPGTPGAPVSNQLNSSNHAGDVAGGGSKVMAQITKNPNLMAALNSGKSVTTVINGHTVTVSRDSSGHITINGKPLVVNGKPNLGLMMQLGY